MWPHCFTWSGVETTPLSSAPLASTNPLLLLTTTLIARWQEKGAMQLSSEGVTSACASTDGSVLDPVFCYPRTLDSGAELL